LGFEIIDLGFEIIDLGFEIIDLGFEMFVVCGSAARIWDLRLLI
jgi:hypothetical protein